MFFIALPIISRKGYGYGYGMLQFGATLYSEFFRLGPWSSVDFVRHWVSECFSICEGERKRRMLVTGVYSAPSGIS